MVKRILIVDGGFASTVIPAQFLLNLEQDEQLTKRVKTHEVFDLFAGVGFGGLLALALATDAKDASKWLTGLTDASRLVNVFNTSLWAQRQGMVRDGPVFDGSNKRKLLETMFGTKLRLSQVHKPVLIPAYNLTERKPVLWQGPSESKSANTLVAELADAATAFPVMFPPVELKDAKGNSLGHFIDASLLTSNNIATSVYLAAQKLFPGEEIKILSLGCGRVTTPLDSPSLSNMGAAQWIQHDLLEIASDPTLKEAECQHLFEALKVPYLRLNATLPADVDRWMGGRDRGSYEIYRKIANDLYVEHRQSLIDFFDLAPPSVLTVEVPPSSPKASTPSPVPSAPKSPKENGVEKQTKKGEAKAGSKDKQKDKKKKKDKDESDESEEDDEDEEEEEEEDDEEESEESEEESDESDEEDEDEDEDKKDKGDDKKNKKKKKKGKKGDENCVIS